MHDPNQAQLPTADTKDQNQESTSHTPSQSILMLKRLGNSWSKRAQIKKQELEPFFEEGKEDFLEKLVPFREMPQYQASSPELKSQILMPPVLYLILL